MVTIDSFEEVFKLNRESLANIEFIEVLDPKTIDNHKAVINALFVVYFELANQYLDEQWYKQRKEGNNKYFTSEERAEKKLRLRLNEGKQ